MLRNLRLVLNMFWHLHQMEPFLHGTLTNRASLVDAQTVAYISFHGLFQDNVRFLAI
jgi:hypothetical protein